MFLKIKSKNDKEKLVTLDYENLENGNIGDKFLNTKKFNPDMREIYLLVILFSIYVFATVVILVNKLIHYYNNLIF